MGTGVQFGGSEPTMHRARAAGLEPLLLVRPHEHDERYRSLVAVEHIRIFCVTSGDPRAVGKPESRGDDLTESAS